MKIYGTKTNANFKKAKEFFDKNSISYTFVDLKEVRGDAEKISFWLNFTDIKNLFNSHSSAYKALKDKNISDEQKITMMIEDAGAIKSPVIEHGLNDECKLTFGFDEVEYNDTFLAK